MVIAVGGTVRWKALSSPPITEFTPDMRESGKGEVSRLLGEGIYKREGGWRRSGKLVFEAPMIFKSVDERNKGKEIPPLFWSRERPCPDLFVCSSSVGLFLA